MMIAQNEKYLVDNFTKIRENLVNFREEHAKKYSLLVYKKCLGESKKFKDKEIMDLIENLTTSFSMIHRENYLKLS